jgi:large subunit ribosomal protein L6
MGKQPVALADKVKVTTSDSEVTVTGPKGTLTTAIPQGIAIDEQDKLLVVTRTGEGRDLRAKHGLCRSLLQNMVVGVSDGFKRELEFQGVGYRGQLKGRQLTLNLGYSNPVEYEVPEGVEVSMPDPTHIVLESIDKQLVGQVAATIRGFRPPDSYKGKGIRYVGEQISLKEGKTVA